MLRQCRRCGNRTGAFSNPKGKRPSRFFLGFPMTSRVVTADDHHAVRAGLNAMLLGTEFEVVAQAADCEQTVAYCLECNPDIVVMDVRMPGGDGMHVIERIKRSVPKARVLVFTAADSIAAIVQAHERGADGFLTKGADQREFIATMRRLAAGTSGWSRKPGQIGTAKRCSYELTGQYMGLTDRESQVLDRIVHGSQNEEIAEELGLNIETIKQHVRSLLNKLGVEDRTQAALWAIQSGLVC